MTLLLRRIKKSNILKPLASIKITVTCLGLLFILTFWGTIAQVDQGLYAAQERFFFSWFFLAAGFIPFPAAKLVLFILFINLLVVACTRFVYTKNNIGILIIHLGLLTYFVAAYITYRVVMESNVMLLEGETTNVSKAYRDWEIAVWEATPTDSLGKKVYAYDSNHLKENDSLNYSDLGFNLSIQDYFLNAQAYTTSTDNKESVFNANGIKTVTKVKLNKEPEKNIPAVKLIVFAQSGKQLATVVLFGSEKKPTPIKVNDKIYDLALQRKRQVLPFKLKLEKFNMEVHPGTQTARSYSSRVVIEHDGFRRESLISMNNPLRYKDWTFYQASYSIDKAGRTYSTLAVVKNWGRVLPYVASLLTFAGLSIHFLTMAFRQKKKRSP